MQERKSNKEQTNKRAKQLTEINFRRCQHHRWVHSTII